MSHKKPAIQSAMHKLKNEGFCAICCTYSQLTKDHVPPKGCNNIDDRNLDQVFPREDTYSVFSRGGTQFKSICANCNNNLLGAQYDPELVKLINKITPYIKANNTSKLYLPDQQLIFTKPHRVARAVIGHLLAALEDGQTNDHKNPMIKYLAEYFLDPIKSFPEKFTMYYWIYPDYKQIVVKNFLRSNLNGNFIIGHTIKFFPLAFYFVYDQPKSCAINLPVFIDNTHMKLDDISQVKIDLNVIMDMDFPEIAKGSGYTLTCDHQNYAARKKE